MKPLECTQDGTRNESTGVSGTDPAHELGRDGRSLLQARLATHGAVLSAFYLLYWPTFYLIWSRDPRVGADLALAQVFQPASFALGVSHLALFLSCRWGSRTVRQLRAIDVGSMFMVGLCFAVLVRNHPCREVAVLEGCLAFMSVLAIRALLVPSSKLRSVLAGAVMVSSLLVLIALDPRPFTGLSIAFASLVAVFVNWSLVAIGFSAFASSVLYGLLLQACGALGEAHARGLIHRDVKPANVFVCRRHGVADMVKVLDFGVVKQQQSERDSMVTLEHALIGTPRYMSPEAISAPSSIDARSDLYSLGVVGYLLLTGMPVFEGETVVEVCAHHLHSTPVAPSQRGVTLPQDLEAVIMRCLQKDRAQRFASADALGEALRQCTEATAWRSEHAQAWWSRHAPMIDARREGEPGGAPGLQQTIAVDGADRTGERRLVETVTDERQAK